MKSAVRITPAIATYEEDYIMCQNRFTAPGAHIIGNVRTGENVGIWYNAVVRGDTNTITIGDNSNVQDNATIHTDADFPSILEAA